jgi:hypothetical protein
MKEVSKKWTKKKNSTAERAKKNGECFLKTSHSSGNISGQ